MAVAEREAIRLHYVDDGQGDPPIVFIHGWCCDHTFFQPQLDHFRRGHRALAMDLRGCGQSDKPEHGYDIPTLADDVAALCRAAGIDNAVIAGHSLGGMMAVDLAARHPALVRAAVAVDPGPLAITPESRALFEAFIAALEGPDSDRARRDYIRDMFLPDADADLRTRITETMCAVPAPIAIDVLRGIVTWNGLGALRLMSRPLLVILAGTGGGNDPARLLSLRPGITFGVTVGAGHFNLLEVPEQVNSMIERFVGSLA
jgi:pimeloyl-ACP methyl ester carboxylesterase